MLLYFVIRALCGIFEFMSCILTHFSKTGLELTTSEDSYSCGEGLKIFVKPERGKNGRRFFRGKTKSGTNKKSGMTRLKNAGIYF